MNRTLLSLVFAVLASVGALYGQAFTGSVTGTVTDPNSAAVPSAAIRLRNTATGETRQTQSSADGRYVLSQVSPGSYVLTVEANGFKTFSTGTFPLRSNQDAEVNAALVLGQVSETVEVSAAAVVLDTQSANQSFTVTTNQMLAMPANARNPFVAVHSMAGVTSMSVGQSNN
ncbi:MAG TPA: carboxypeptidase-like regulatory domain-containing protein, partial [Bryobacteraceae bacterium]|nr:carboxypeptidase-like regulatory domain-containing protein [Bryobacteraceae bacterium]